MATVLGGHTMATGLRRLVEASLGQSGRRRRAILDHNGNWARLVEASLGQFGRRRRAILDHNGNWARLV